MTIPFNLRLGLALGLFFSAAGLMAAIGLTTETPLQSKTQLDGGGFRVVPTNPTAKIDPLDPLSRFAHPFSQKVTRPSSRLRDPAFGFRRASVLPRRENAISVSASALPRPGDIITYAGGGGGDNGRAKRAAVLAPLGLALGADGSIYFAEFVIPFGENRVRKVDPAGVIHSFAGTGAVEPFKPFSGDGKLAVHDPSMVPQSLAVDAAGNVYLTDRWNNRVRKVDTSGVITTVAGNGDFGFSGDGGPATSAQINVQFGFLAIDGNGNLYIADQANNRVRKVDSSGTITTVAGNGKANPCNPDCTGDVGDGLPARKALVTNPFGLAFDQSGNLYISEGDSRVRKVDAATGLISTVAGNGTFEFTGDGGPATQAGVGGPLGLAFDAAGNLYIADNGPFVDRIRKVDAATQIITSVVGSGPKDARLPRGDGGPATEASIYFCWGIAFDSADNLYLTDWKNRIRKVDPAGTITTAAGAGRAYAGNGRRAARAELDIPFSSYVDPAGTLYIADTYNDRVRKVNPSGIITTIAGDGYNTCGEEALNGDDYCHGRFAGDGGPAIDASLNRPAGVTTDSAGNIYIAERDNNRIRKIDTAGIITTVAGNGQNDENGSCLNGIGDGGPATSACLGNPYSVTIDASGNLYIADFYNARIRKVDTSGIITTYAGNGAADTSGDGGPAPEAGLGNITGVAVDQPGNVYIATFFQERIRKVDAALSTDGTHHISTIAGTGTCGFSGDGGPATSAELCTPEGVAVDAAGNVYIADTDTEHIRKVDTAGIITSIAGASIDYYYGGDRGPALQAGFFFPSGVAISSSGDLYIADSENKRIRKITYSPPGYGQK